jgi:hypothetical protein
VTLPGFWTKEALEAIGNKLGVFVGLEPNWESKADCRWDWIQIEVDVRKGLVGNMDFVFGEHTWHQKVEYWKIHFYCFVCHAIGHVQSQCKQFSPLFNCKPKIWAKRAERFEAWMQYLPF